MELKLFWPIVRRGWWLILLPPLAALAYSLATYQAPAAAYALTLRYTAGQPQTPAGLSGYDPNYYRWLASEYIVSGLKDWVRTGAFAEAVAADLAAHGQTLPAPAVAGLIANADNARSILWVYLSGSDPAQLQAVAGAVGRVLAAENAAIFPQLGGQAAVVTPLDAPSPGLQAPGLRSQLDLPLRLALALAAGLALALAAHYLDPYVRDQRELEQAGLSVVAVIPPRRKK